MTDIERCPLPQGHQRHRWFDCGQEVKCPGITVCAYCGLLLERRGGVWLDDDDQRVCDNVGWFHDPTPARDSLPAAENSAEGEVA